MNAARAGAFVDNTLMSRPSAPEYDTTFDLFIADVMALTAFSQKARLRAADPPNSRAATSAAVSMSWASAATCIFDERGEPRHQRTLLAATHGSVPELRRREMAAGVYEVAGPFDVVPKVETIDASSRICRTSRVVISRRLGQQAGEFRPHRDGVLLRVAPRWLSASSHASPVSSFLRMLVTSFRTSRVMDVSK
jgi:hypothetical protein